MLPNIYGSSAEREIPELRLPIVFSNVLVIFLILLTDLGAVSNVALSWPIPGGYRV